MAQRVRRDELVRAARAAIAECAGDRLVALALAGEAAPARAAIAGVGKAAGAMAEGALARWPEAQLGPLVAKEAHPRRAVLLGGHPLPDERSGCAGEALLGFAGSLDADATLLLLLSGGASALAGAPVPGLSLAGLRAATTALSAAGATIQELNCVRRRLGALSGGRLAAACPARIEVLALSDVLGDAPEDIGSGPCSADPTSAAEALAVLDRFGVAGEAREFLAGGSAPSTVGPGDPRLARVRFRVIATAATLADACAAGLAATGRTVRRLEAARGEVGELAARYAAVARSLAPGEVTLAVGEPTVRLASASGRGGRAQQLALLLARALDGGDACFAAIASDGSDGPTDAAGAAVDGTTWAAAKVRGLDPDRALAACDAYPLLDSLALLERTGPTGTNLLDLHLIGR